MAKTITINYEGVDYKLEFTRKTVQEMEDYGFNVKEIGTKPMTMLPTLFEGAFLAHHRMKNNQVVKEIFDKLEDKEGLMTKLAEMYNEPLDTLFDEPEPSEKNAKWEASF